MVNSIIIINTLTIFEFINFIQRVYVYTFQAQIFLILKRKEACKISYMLAYTHTYLE